MTNKPQNRKERTTAFINQVTEEREEQSSFAKVLIGMTIVFIGVVLAIFVMAGSDKFFVDNFGEDAFITNLFRKLQSGGNKEHADFALPFGLRRQNILFMGVDASENPDDPWTGTRTDTIILVNIDPKTYSA